MSKQVWICEKCQSLWRDEESAKECEQRHKEPISVEGLTWPKYERRSSPVFPETVLVKIDPPGDHGWDYATYRLDHVGPVGC